MNGSVFKLNHSRAPLGAPSPCGYRRLSIAREGLDASVELVDPDGNRVRLVPPGSEGVVGIEIELGVREEAAFDATHAEILAAGGEEAHPPRTLGETARIAFVRDPDGNWIELSQRASLTGSLEPE
jgi:lactoylglutathione lyase